MRIALRLGLLTIVVAWAACTSNNAAVGLTDGIRDGAGDGGLGDGRTGDGQALPDAFLSDALTDRPLGSVCNSASQCASGFCAAGVCCEQACNGPCRRCDSPTARGRCTDAPAGTKCGDAGCSQQNSGVLQLASFCNGDGQCRSAGELDCNPYGCDNANAQCFASCTQSSGSSQCTQNQPCVSGHCGSANSGLPFGAACTSGSQCNSGTCASGVCCDAACTGDCESCAVPGAVGKCIAVPSGSAPIDASKSCPAADPTAPCGFDGKCDGQRHCRVAPENTPCGQGQGSCVDGTEASRVTLQACNGERQQPRCETRTNGCGSYVCNAAGTACLQSCSGQADCRTGRFCVSSRCVQCRDNNDCTNGRRCINGECGGG